MLRVCTKPGCLFSLHSLDQTVIYFCNITFVRKQQHNLSISIQSCAIHCYFQFADSQTETSFRRLMDFFHFLHRSRTSCLKYKNHISLASFFLKLAFGRLSRSDHRLCKLVVRNIDFYLKLEAPYNNVDLTQ